MFEHAGEYKQIYKALLGGRGSVIVIHEIRRVLSEIVQKELSGVQKDKAIPQESPYSIRRRCVRYRAHLVA
jgi:hypothetical protein